MVLGLVSCVRTTVLKLWVWQMCPLETVRASRTDQGTLIISFSNLVRHKSLPTLGSLQQMCSYKIYFD